MALFPVIAGQAQLSTAAPVASDVFQSGILLDGAYTLARVAFSGGVGYVNGLLRTALGQIVCVDATAGLPAGTIFVSGLPLDPNGALCVSSGAAFTWQNGLPFVANGALAGTTSLDSQIAAMFAAANSPLWIPDIDDLKQDRAGTIPVTADGDPVRWMRDRSGQGFHLAPATDAGFGTYKVVGGVGFVRIPAAGWFATAKTRTLQLPLYTVAGMARRTNDIQQLFGLLKDNNNRAGISNRTTLGQLDGRLVQAVGGTSAATSQPIDAAPLYAPVVVSSLMVPGTTDVSLDGNTPISVANVFGATSDTGYCYAITSVNGTAAGTAEIDWYGGGVMHAVPSDRALIESYFAQRVTIPATPNDYNILIIGDSTGDELTEWVRKHADYLAAQDPTKSVLYRGWNDTSGKYGAEIRVSTGSGPQNIRIYNSSRAGSQPDYHMGARFQSVIVDVKPSVIWWNHGHNLTGVPNDDAGVNARGKFLGAMDQVRIALPGVPQLLVRQTPNQPDNAMDRVIAGFDWVASAYGDMPVADVYSAEVARGKPTGDYLGDGVHPSIPTGVLVYNGVIDPAWTAAQPLSPTGAAFFSTKAANLLANGDFSSFSGSVPTGWTLTGNGTVSKDTTITTGGHPYSTRLLNGVSGQTDLSQTISAVPYQGGYVTVCDVQWLVAGGDTSSGQISLTVNGTGGSTSRNQGEAKPTGGWRLVVLSIAVPADATTITFSAAASVTGVGDVRHDRIVLVAGEYPRDML